LHSRYGTSEKTNGADIRSLVAANAVMDRLVGVPEELIPQGISDSLREQLSSGLLAYVPNLAEVIEQHLKSLQKVIPDWLRIRLSGVAMLRGITIYGARTMVAQPKIADYIYRTLLKKGVYVRKSKHTLIIKPPLVITKEELDGAFLKIIEVFNSIDITLVI
jgi:adenosylmethionine-8-amino-7-oxononanoate aminotransferase